MREIELLFLTSANWSSGKRLEAFAALGTYRAGLIGCITGMKEPISSWGLEANSRD